MFPRSGERKPLPPLGFSLCHSNLSVSSPTFRIPSALQKKKCAGYARINAVFILVSTMALWGRELGKIFVWVDKCFPLTHEATLGSQDIESH